MGSTSSKGGFAATSRLISHSGFIHTVLYISGMASVPATPSLMTASATGIRCIGDAYVHAQNEPFTPRGSGGRRELRESHQVHRVPAVGM